MIKKNYFLIFSVFLIISFSFLNPIHFNPWPSFLSEIIFFIGFLYLVLISKVIYIPKKILFILFLSIIPIIQFLLGWVFYFSIAILGSIYIFCFWLSIVVAYNLVCEKNLFNQNNDILLMDLISYFYIFICFSSSIIAIIQWLNIPYSTQYISGMVGNRPFANLAQPNHLATLISMGVIGCFYLYERKKLNSIILIFFTFIFLFAIALTQSRTTWLFVLVLIVFVLYKRKDFNFRLSVFLMLLWLGLFILFVLSIPSLSDFLSNYFNIIIGMGIVERATTGYLRFDIWNQAIHAIMEKPWFGYGWNQTSSAQYIMIERYPGKEWFSSAHNIILDIFLWNGIILGSLVVLFFSISYLSSFIRNKKIDTIFSCFMLMPILVHCFLEYPFKYAYFLLPAGFFWGIMISEGDMLRYKIRSVYFKVIPILSFILLGYIFKEFSESIDNNLAANTYEMNEREDQFELAYPVYILDEFRHRSQWFALYPYTKLDRNDLDEIKKMVSLHLTSYDLLKFAKILSYNGYRNEAISQLKILEILYGKKYTYCDIIYNKELKHKEQ